MAEGAEKYPHNMNVFNLCRMKAVGFERWRDEAAGICARYFKGKFVIGAGPKL